MKDWESSLITSTSKLPVPGPNLPVGIAIDTFQSILNSVVESTKIKEYGRTARTNILAEKDKAIMKMELDNARAMADDAKWHEWRMEVTKSICKLLVDNAKELTPDARESCQILLSLLREYS